MASLLNISRALTKHSVVNTLKVARNNKIKTTRYFSVASALQHYNHRSSSVLAPGDIKKMYDNSMNDPNSFWGTHGRDYLHWIKDFQQVSNSDMANGKHEWFLGGKLNVSVNCLDRHVAKDPNATALIWERDEPNTHLKVSYKELLEKTCQVANVLKRKGIQKGDTVCIYMPVSPIAVACMLACARIGAVHSVVFAGFSAEALSARISNGGSKLVITADEGLRGSKRISLKKTVDKALETSDIVNTVLVYQRTGAEIQMQPGRDSFLEEEMLTESTECAPEPMESEDPLFILYTSGSTGKPKGVQHTQAGYLLYVMMTHKHVFKYEIGDIYACVADIGWITGHSYVVYGPLANGATSVLFESVPTYPDPGRYWEMVERLKVNQFYGAPTAIRLLLKYGNEFVDKYNRDSLKVLGTVGEPINEEAWHWYYNVVGQKRCPIADTWWQTETGGIVISPLPEQEDVSPKPACPMFPFFGVQPVLLNEQGEELHGNNVSGLLCLATSLPGMARTIHGDQERFLDVYYRPYPGYYFTGDGARRDADGHYHITGRVDDVINVKGVRLGTAEVEDIMDNHDAVAETAVVGYPHEIKGQGVYAYVTLKEGVSATHESIKKELQAMVKQSIGSFAVPEMIQITPGLPKTRSGKIMRRILRCVAANKPDEVGDTSTLADDSVINEIVINHKKLLADLNTNTNE